MIAPSLNAHACVGAAPRQRYRVVQADGDMLSRTLGRNDVIVKKRAALVSLLAEVANGSEDAFKTIYDATSSKLFGVCLPISTNHECAAEALQDTYLVVWRRAERCNNQRGNPITWLAAIAHNFARTRILLAITLNAAKTRPVNKLIRF